MFTDVVNTFSYNVKELKTYKKYIFGLKSCLVKGVRDEISSNSNCSNLIASHCLYICLPASTFSLPTYLPNYLYLHTAPSPPLLYTYLPTKQVSGLPDVLLYFIEMRYKNFLQQFSDTGYIHINIIF